MKLKFKRQQYQEDAAFAVVKCFEGQPFGSRRDLVDRIHRITDEGTLMEQEFDEDIISFGNKKIDLSEKEQRDNINKVQNENRLDLTPNEGLLNYSIEMETGTGKTYTYIKTMYELNKAYGWSKFIVIVPSVAIREGVNKSFEITQDDFQEKYGKKIRFFVYDSSNSSNISNIKSYAEDDNINVIIMNFQAFNSKSKDNKKIYDENLDETGNRSPISIIRTTNPILIIDEPQKMGKTEEMLDEFDPLFILRYSATHKDKFKYNMIYRLDAVDAYNQKLVKKINVKGIEVLNDKAEDTYLYLERVELSSSEPVAKVEMEVKSANGTKRVFKTIKRNDNLFDLSGELNAYKGWIVDKIDATNSDYDMIYFSNDKSIKSGQAIGDAEESILARIQIRETIKSHFEKERELFSKGIKVLSLFFIDEVAKYKYYVEGEKHSLKGEYAKIFDEEYTNILNEYYSLDDPCYKEYLDSLEGKKVDSGYFSVDKKKSSSLEGEEYIIESKIDDKTEGTSSDQDAYDLIMKDKERLLSFDEPVRFIFSHSALREGWDNPNIFQICTLRKTGNVMSRRQEVGRGLRICVNQKGERMDFNELEEDFFNINNLTIITSGSYEEFATGLQKEVSETLSRKYYEVLTPDIFKKKIIKSKDGIKEISMDDPINYNKYINNHFLRNGYIDDDSNITQKLREDIANNRITIPDGLDEYVESYVNLIKHLFTDNKVPIENNEKKNIKILSPNSNFEREEFQKLWKKINIKTSYTVNFSSEELIIRAIDKINKELVVSKMKIKIGTGSQKNSFTANQVRNNDGMEKESEKVELYDGFVESNIKYDLVGTLAKETGLTRKTIIAILTGIEKTQFGLYKYNPEEFIRKVSKLINETKATTIIDGITYNKINESFDNNIFTINNINGRMGDNAFEVKKHIYDYLVTDSDNERKFAKKLEEGAEVTIYAKLPNGFKIPTPVGNYNPDWAIVFDDKQFKYVYFIAETKGSMSSMELREVEKAKIECAKKHFASICNDEFIKYDVVDSYEELINILSKA